MFVCLSFMHYTLDPIGMKLWSVVDCTPANVSTTVRLFNDMCRAYRSHGQLSVASSLVEKPDLFMFTSDWNTKNIGYPQALEQININKTPLWNVFPDENDT